MNEKSFKDNLKTDNVIEDKLNVFPNIGVNKQRLEVEKIDKIIADVTDGNFEKFEFDEDVYNALQSTTAQDIRLILKACANTLGIDCAVEPLQKLNKPRMVALFFESFGVYPEKNPIIDGGPVEDDNDDDSIDEEDFQAIFPNFTGAVELDFAKVANFLPPQFRAIQSVDELKKSFTQKNSPEGQDVRIFVEGAIKAAGINCNFTELNAMRREEYLPLFFHAINFTFTKKIDKPTPPPTEKKVVTADIINLRFAHFDAIFNAAEKISAFDLDFDIAGELKIFEDNPVTVKDGFYFNIPDGYEILRGLVGIATLDGKIAAIGHIEDGIVSGRILPHAVFDWNKIHAEEFANRKRFLAVLIPKDAENFFAQPMSQSLAESYNGKILTLEFTLNYKALAVTDRPLCIDFGTSNTTCGTYDFEKGGTPELVTFRDVTSDEIVDREILPTIVYVESCRDGIVNYKFGYEAKKEIMNAGYDTKASVFYEIKRWLNSLDVVEEVTDKNGNYATVKRGEILREYLLHVIKAAEQQYQVKFNTLHMTAPVKLRNKFIREMKKILPQYKIDEKGLDEGVAIVYHYIAEKIKTIGDAAGKILILDCGGGTTDLASCNFSIDKSGDWAVLNIETDFENCDSNFGGNNITYRILQMLKMKIAANIQRSENLTMQELIPDDDDNILSQIDFNYENKNEIYKKFEDEYSRVEELIPTKFAECSFANERRKIKRNFYYLWQIAEAIKIEFFKSNLVNVDFEEDKKIYVKNPAEYYLSIRQGGKLQKFDNPMDGVEITIREIVRIILPDLYALLTTLLRHYGDNELTTYKFRLSGQSCKIHKFRDLFKEFVPGKLLRMATERGKIKSLKSADSVALKKYCIFGSIEYVRDAQARGEHKPLIRYKPNRRIYEINIVVGGDEKSLMSRTGELQIKKFPGSTKVVEFWIRGVNNHIERKIHHHLDKSDNAKRYSLEDVIKMMASETTFSETELTDSIGEALQDVELPKYNDKIHGMMCVAALESADSYGFNVYQIYIEPDENIGKKYWIPNKRTFYSYEDENLQTFFNGDK